MRFLFLFSLFLRFVFEFFVYEILGLERLEVNGFFFFFFLRVFFGKFLMH